MRRWLLLLFLTTMAVNWPPLPFNARITDVIFIATAVAILAHREEPASPKRRRREGERPLTLLDLAILAYIAGSALAAIFSPDPRASAIELGRQLYLVAVYVVIAMAARQGLTQTLATGMALSGAMLAALGLIAFVIYTATGIGSPLLTPVMTLPYVGDTARLAALTATPAMLACVLTMSLPFAALHPFVAASRRRTIGAGAMFGAGALLTYSHSMAGLAVASVIAAWRSIRARAPVRIAAIALAIVIVAALNFAASFSIRSIGGSPLGDDTVSQYGVDSGRIEIAGLTIDYRTMSYLRIKQVAWDVFRSEPLTGVGLDRFHRATEIAYAQGRLTRAYRAVDPHSTFFGRLAETGLVGAVTLVALWIAIAVTLDGLMVRHPDSWIVIAATAGIAGTLVNSINVDAMNFRFLWVALGLVRGFR